MLLPSYTAGPGVVISNRKPDGSPSWGYIEKCPHCSATNIVRVSPNQKTCGKIPCQAKANLEAKKKWRARRA